MEKRQTRRFFITIQIILWLVFFLVWLGYGGIKWKSFEYAFLVSLVYFSCYAILIYGNGLWLYPKLYKKQQPWPYITALTIFFIVISTVRLFAERLILFPIQHVFYNYALPHISLVFITNAIALLVGILLRIAADYMHLLKKQEEMKSQQLATELNLLKQQVQPHFLFNTLNNIYSLAHAKSDNTKVAIAKLADMMRYFTEEAPKEKVALQTETAFIKNYIDLEQLRMTNPIKITTNFAVENIQVPAMLLMPFVENLFKHGVDKTRQDNEAILDLNIEGGRLKYSVRNKLCDEIKNGSGVGLNNLKKRLDLLYGENYLLQVKPNGKYFEAYMEIPV